ncbi:MAG: hypothetical protein ABSH48_27545 [Verrucomicrobiota bacterium]|jgi:hypothetical protein
MTLKEHLQQTHQRDAEHHAIKAAEMHKLSEHFGALAARQELTNPADSKCHKDISACCKVMAESHAKRGEKCIEEHKAAGMLPDTAMGPTGKAASSDREAFLERLVLKLAGGAGISAGLSLIPRHGAPDPRANDTRSNLDPFLKNVIVPEEQEPVAPSVIRSGRTQF